MAKDLQDKLAQAKAFCNLGLAHKALGEYNKAEECQRYLLSIAQALDNTQVALSETVKTCPVCEELLVIGVVVFVSRRFSGPLGTSAMCACVEAICREL